MNPWNAVKSYLHAQPEPAVLLKRALALAVLVLTLVVLVDVLTPQDSQATLPVVDLAAVGQMVQQSIHMEQQLQTMYQQILVMKNQVQAVTGHYGMGALGVPVNGWSHHGWNDVVNMVNHGVNPGDGAQVAAYYAARNTNLAAFPALDDQLQTRNPRMKTAYTSGYQDSIAGMSAGEGTINSIQIHLNELQLLKDKIETTVNLKSSMDLNTAVNVKVAQINADLLRLEAMSLHLQATQGTTTASGQAAQSEFFNN